jgi:hypothetical protein
VYQSNIGKVQYPKRTALSVIILKSRKFSSASADVTTSIDQRVEPGLLDASWAAYIAVPVCVVDREESYQVWYVYD